MVLLTVQRQSEIEHCLQCCQINELSDLNFFFLQMHAAYFNARSHVGLSNRLRVRLVLA